MENESFEKQDRSLMETLKGVRDKKIPSVMMKNFSVSVEDKIRERQPSLEIQVKPKRSWVPVWAPVFAVLMIGSLLVLRLPMGSREMPLTPSSVPVQLAQANVNELSDDIAALRELGAWTDDDEKSAGIGTESELEDLELSKASVSLETQLT